MRVGPRGGVILAYHNVVEDHAALRAGVDELTVTESQLRSHLRMLKMLRLQVVDVSHIAGLVARGLDTSGLAAITFDDALAGVARVGLQVLEASSVRGTIFVPTDNPGVEPAFWPGAEPTMTTEELGRAVGAGHTLGSHTATHRSLVTLDAASLDDELGRSRSALESLTNDGTVAFAYPSGHHNAEVRAAVLRAGYTSACTFSNGRATAELDAFRLPRLTMGAHSSRLRFLYHLLRPAGSWPDHQQSEIGPA